MTQTITDPITGEISKNDAGSRHVTTEKTGVAHNRNIAAAAATHPGNDTSNTATWTISEGVTELTIDAVGATAAGLQNDEKYLVLINAPTASIAKSWLDDAGSASQDVVYEMGNLTEQKIIKRTTAITRIDVLPLGGISMRFVIGAV